MRKTHNDSPVLKNQQQLELADIFRLYADDYRRSHAVSYQQLKVMHHIQICRTAKLGGHVEQCDQCAFEQIAYNSCRDRHCPKCQTLTKEQWLNDRKAELLGCSYFHLVWIFPKKVDTVKRKVSASVFHTLKDIDNSV
jgi:predicted Zn-ribbon and HTH transcriptional regulator